MSTSPLPVIAPPFGVAKDSTMHVDSSREKDVAPPSHELLPFWSVGRLRMVDITLRSFILAFAAVSISFMATSSQRGIFNVFGLSIPITMKWSTSQPYLFLVVVQSVICTYAFLQFIYQSVIIAKKLPLCRKSMWIQLAADQTCVYLVLAAAAAAAGASRMSRKGFQNLGLGEFHIPSVCSVLDRFCMRTTIAIISTLIVTFASSICAALDVYMLTLTY